jgi:hypothetical protein
MGKPLDDTIARFTQLTQLVLRLSRPWVATMLVVASLSTIHITVDHHHRLSGSFGIGGTTVVLLALIWLPAAIRVLSVAGGGIKTPAGEATTPGLLEVFAALDPQTKRDTLPPVLTALSSAEVLVDPDRRVQSDHLRRDLELQLASVVPLSGGVRETLDGYAKAYEGVRASSLSGRERTMRMTTITAEARAVARVARLSTADLRHLVRNGSDGERVIAFALMQDHPDVQLLDQVCDGVTDSRSAFEQYQALAAAFELLPRLDYERRRILRSVLESALTDPRRGIRADSSRALLVDTMLEQLDE